MDVDSFTPLVDFKFDSPTLEMEDAPTFGCLVACVNLSLKMIHKVRFITRIFFKFQMFKLLLLLLN